MLAQKRIVWNQNGLDWQVTALCCDVGQRVNFLSSAWMESNWLICSLRKKYFAAQPIKVIISPYILLYSPPLPYRM